jgi:ech hydrogenase subunit D
MAEEKKPDIAKTVAAKLAAKLKADGKSPAEIAAAVKAALAKIAGAGAAPSGAEAPTGPQLERIGLNEYLEKFTALEAKGYRLGQLSAMNGAEGVELIYSLTNGAKAVENYVLPLKGSVEIESVSNLFPGAFIYENEIHDLFGITFKNLSVDFGGHFFKLKGKTPWKESISVQAAEPAADKKAEGAK